MTVPRVPAPSFRKQACTFPGCEQRACAVHEDWQRRTASRLWLHFDRTVRGRPHPSTSAPANPAYAGLPRRRRSPAAALQVYAAEMLNERRQMLLHELERRRGVAARFLHQSV